jgi:16S rRNA G966 N2-methylase RsmD
MNDAEMSALRSDMRNNGYRPECAIVLYGTKILDGRNRYEAAGAENIEPTYIEYTGNDPLGYVISLNLHRRHLNESQRAVVASKLETMKHGGDRKNQDANLHLDRNEAAEMLNVSPRTVATIKQIEREAPEMIDRIASGEMTAHEAHKEIQTEKRTEARAEMARAGADVPQAERWNVWQGDIETWQAPRQYDFIITDPPYPKEYLPLYSTLARRAKEWLKPGGLLIAMSAHYWMPDIYKMLDEHLDYFWTAAYLVPGETAGVFQKHVNPQWKPLIMYQLKNAPFSGRGFADVFKSDANDKKHHEWGQSESGMFDIISKICSPGQYILDPFCGAGTTGVAALKHGCLFDGIDILDENVNISKSRINESL